MTETRVNRVAITGMGTICGLGHNLPEVWKRILNGDSGISTLENIDASALPVKFAGEVKNFEISEELLAAKEAPRYDKFIHFAMHSTNEAILDSGVLESDIDLEKVGCILGVGMGGFPIIEATHSTFLEKGPRRVSPFFIPAIIPNMASGMISIKYGLKGTNYSVASACASAGHAITSAVDEIRLGRHDAMVTGGAESVLTHLPISGFNSMKAVSKNNDEPEKASRPFDVARNGFVMGEGAGILVLENLEKAKARGAKIYAEIVGCGSSSDSYHITAPHPEGAGAIRCMKRAIEESGVDPKEITHINAHGTSTPLGDIAETKTIKEVFGSHAKNIMVSSTKSMVGHLLGAAGGIESIFCAMAVYENIAPPTINLKNQDPECDLNYVANKAQKGEIKYAMNNSFGFGGTNSSIVFKEVN